MGPLEWTAVVFGLTCIYLTTRQNIWCWPSGVVMVSLYFVIFYQARLYSDMGLQVVYFVLQFYGWYSWLYGGKGGGRLPVTRITLPRLASWALAAAICTFSLGYLMDRHTDADLAYWDATTTVLSLIAQYWMSRKVIEHWLVWITVDALSIGIYAYKGLHPTAALYFVFLLLCVSGYVQWKRTLAQTDADPHRQPAPA